MISGITFSEQRVPVSAHRAIFSGAVHDGILDGCRITYSGNRITISAGHMIAHGAEIAISGTETVTVSGVAGFARVKLRIDTTKAATASSFAQASFAVDYASTLDAFNALTQQEINLDGTVYEMQVCIAALSSSGITSIVHKARAQLGLEALSAVITLSPAAWVDGEQTVTVSGVDTLSVVLPAPVPTGTNAVSYSGSGISCIRQGVNSLTFACSSVPAAAILVNVLILNGVTEVTA